MVDREGGCMRGVRKDPIIGGAVCPEDIRLNFYQGGRKIYLSGPCSHLECVCVCEVQKKGMLALEKNCALTGKKNEVCSGKRSVCVRYPFPDHRHFPKGQFCLLAFLFLDRSFVSSMSPLLPTFSTQNFANFILDC